ncbi:MAG TPA: hypothetical protein VHW66_02745 [Stellaceae bacterium]|nr:hypothetical protein [Stellaceae bacterium]
MARKPSRAWWGQCMATYNGTYFGGFVIGSAGQNPVTFGPQAYITRSGASDVSATVSATIDNQGTIAGGNGGVYLQLDGTLTNSGTIRSDGGPGIHLEDGGNVVNAASGVTAGYIYGDTAILIDGAAGTVGNYGRIKGGADLRDGGAIVNGANGATAALISGGAYTGGAAGTVVNYATITGGVELHNGGSVANTGAAAYISGDVKLQVGGAVANAGTISGSGAYGVVLNHGGSVANTSAAALISGGAHGIADYGAAGTVTNYGTIIGTAGDGVYFYGYNNTVTNAGKIAGASGHDAILFGSGNDRLIVDPGAVFTGTVGGGAGTNTLELASTTSTGAISGLGTSFVGFGTITVDADAQWNLTGGNTIASGVTLADDGILTNSGTLTGSGTLFVDPGTMVNSGSVGIAVTLDGGSYLDNTSTGLISVAGTAVYGDTYGADSVTNAGTIEATGAGGVGIDLKNGGSVSNTGTALITGYNFGVRIDGGPGTVTNTGMIGAPGTTGLTYGIYLKDGGSVVNGSTSVTNALIYSNYWEVGVNGAAGTITNYGTISGPDIAISLHQGGTVVNGPSGATAALISSFQGIYINGDAGAVINAGTIQASSYGVYLQAGGYVANNGAAALIRGSVLIAAGDGTVTNAGTIIGEGEPGNQDDYGIGVGFKGTYSDTLTNSGTIIGRTGYDAVKFSGTADRLIVDPGAVFTGAVDGGAGTNTLELASAANIGTITGLGTSFVGFGTITVDSGARWHLTGSNTIASGYRLTDSGTVTAYGTLTNSGTLTGSGTLFVDPGTMINSGSVGIAVTLDTGSYLYNTETGLISPAGADTVISTTNGAVSVVNAGSITASAVGVAAVKLMDGGSVVNGPSGATTALISAGVIGVDIEGADGFVANAGTISASVGISILKSGTVTNSGTVAGTGGPGDGIYLQTGGSVANTTNAALISGRALGIEIEDAAGIVSNAGTIAATGAGGDGVKFVGSYGDAVTNSGTIAGGAGGDAVLFGGGSDTLAVDPGAVFIGDVDAGLGTDTMELGSGASIGTISGVGTKYLNFEAIAEDANASWVVSGSDVPAVTVAAGATFANAGTITTGSRYLILYSFSYGNAAVYGTGSAVSVVNTGTVSLTGNREVGIYLKHGGSVDNSGATALISAYSAGIRIASGAGTVTNAGTITGSGNYFAGALKYAAVELSAGGSVDNSGTIAGGGRAIYIGGGTGTVTNSGVVGYIQLGVSGGSVANIGTTAQIGSIYFGNLANGYGGENSVSGTVTNDGTIGGHVFLYSGSISNTDTAALISGYIRIAGSGAVVSNAGTIASGIEAVYGTSVTNTNTAALISGGIQLGNTGNNQRGDSTVSNAGTIAGGFGVDSVGVELNRDGTISNIGTASLIHAFTGIFLSGGVSTVTNAGSIIAERYTARPQYSYPIDGVVIEGATFVIDNQAGGLISAPNGVYGVFDFLGGGGTLTNAGTIYGVVAGVDLAGGGASTVINAGTIAGGGSDAVMFGNSDDRLIVDPGAVFTGIADGAGGTNTLELGSAAGIGTITGLGTSFVNFGAVTVDAGAQWYLTGGNTIVSGVLTNLGTLTGSGYLIVDPATMVNSGYVGIAVTLDTGSYLDNTGTGAITVGGTAVYGAGTAVGAVNLGSVYGTGTAGVAFYLKYGGTISNNAAGQISGASTGIVVSGTYGTVGNAGTIAGGAKYGIYLKDGGSIANTGNAALISGNFAAVLAAGAVATVTNTGSIAGNPAFGVGIYLADGGTVTNGSVVATGAAITGYSGIRVGNSGNTTTGVVTNYATIEGTAGSSTKEYGVELYSSGTVINGSALSTSAAIEGYYWGLRLGINGASPGGTVSNFGTIEATSATAGMGISLGSGGTVDNGSALSPGATIRGGRYGIDSGYGGTVTNYGTVEGGVTGVDLSVVEGSLANGGTASSAAQITGGRGVYMLGGTLTNFGLIEGSASGTSGLPNYFGVYLLGGGSVANSGTIEGLGSALYRAYGITLGNGGTVSNNTAAALISGYNYGVDVGNLAGVVTNSGTIEATGTAGVGIRFNEADSNTLTNAGTIIGASGFDAVLFGGGDDTVIVDPHAVFSGLVDGGGGYNTLGLGSSASTGTISLTGATAIGFGTTFVDFGTITVEPNARWSLTGSNTIASGVTLADDGILTNSGILTGSGYLIVDPGTMINSGSVGIAVTLDTGSYLYNTSTGTITVATGPAVIGTGDTVSVLNAGTISGYSYGVEINGTAGTVTNLGTIEAISTGFGVGVYLSQGGTVANGVSGSTSGTIGGDTYGVEITGAAGTVTNFGTIEAISTGFGVGVYLSQGGTVANGVSGSTSGTIGGDTYGVEITGAAGTVTNFGKIEAISTNFGAGVFLGSAGYVSNGSIADTTAAISGYTYGVEAKGASGSTVLNCGAIAASGRYGEGVYLAYGGLVTNGVSGGSTATIIGYYRGVYTNGTLVPGVVVNYGTIESTETGYGEGVKLRQGGTVINGPSGAGSALIEGYTGVESDNGPGTLYNYGIVSATGYAVDFRYGGLIVNGVTGQIEGGTGVYIDNYDTSPTGTLLNYGIISATGAGAYLYNGSTVTNGTNGDTTAEIQGYIGVRITAATGTMSSVAGTVTNFAAIEGGSGLFGVGVELDYGGTVTNGSPTSTAALIEGYTGVRLVGHGAVYNYGAITGTGSEGVELSDGSVTNGATNDSTATIGGYYYGVRIDSPVGAVVNFGTIEATGTEVYGGNAGVALFAGFVINGAANDLAATISGYSYGVRVYGAAGVVVNFGAIEGSATAVAYVYHPSGVYLADGGTVINGPGGATTAVIGGLNGVVISGAAGTVTNYAAIEGSNRSSGNGVVLAYGGTVTNGANVGATATIQGYVGVYVISATGAVTNFGTVLGGHGYGTGVYMRSAGILTNEAGALIEGGEGVLFGVGTYGTVSTYGTLLNYGTIATLPGAPHGLGIGVGIIGGTVVNGASGFSNATISGFRVGIASQVYAPTTITNFGTVENTSVLAGFGIALGGGLIVNEQGGRIYGTSAGITAYAGTILNDGMIASTGTRYDTAIAIYYDGTIVNGSTADTAATIRGNDSAIYLDGAGTIANYGTIEAVGVAGTYTTSGIYLYSGPLTNGSSADTTALITSSLGSAVVVADTASGGAGTIANFGTISTTGPQGLAAVVLYQGGTVANSGLILATDGTVNGVELLAGGTVGNTGSIVASGMSGTGVYLSAATVYNGLSGSSAGFIGGYRYGVYGNNAVAHVVNYGTITETGTSGGAAVELHSGGSIGNAGTILAGGTGSRGVVLQGGATAGNTGSIVASGMSGIGVYLGAATVDNGLSGSSSGFIGGYRFGLYGNGTAANVVNFGTIEATGASGAIAVDLAAGGTVTNAGSISGPGGVYIAGGSGPNLVTNAAAGQITATKIAVDLKGVAGTLLNYGAVLDTGATSAAVYLGAGGSVVNGSTADSTATIGSTARTAVSVKNIAATVTNFGTISSAATGASGTGVYLSAGGKVVNEATGLVTAYRSAISAAVAPATVANYGTIASTGSKAPAVYLGAGGRVVNGASGATQALIESTNDGAVVIAAGVGSVDNFGTILVNGSNGSGVYFNHGGTIANEAGATISAYRNAVSFGVTAASLVNLGSIATTGAHAAVYSDAGGLVVNGSTANAAAEIGAAKGAVTFEHAAGTVVNYGTLAATGTGGSAVYVGAGGTITNKAGALLTGVTEAVGLGGTIGATLINYGTVATTGTPGLDFAVQMASAGTVLNHGTIGSGIFVGGTSTTAGAVDIVNTALVTGTTGIGISGFAIGANSIVNYGTITGTNGIAVQLGGNHSTLVIEPNSVLNGAVSNFHTGDVIDFAHKEGNGFTFGSQVLTLTNNGTVLGTVGVSGVFGTGSFVLTSDGAGGSDIKVAGSVFSGVYPFGITLGVPSIENPATFTSTAYVTNTGPGNDNSAVYGISGTSWVVDNAGTIVSGTGADANGILLASGGTVSNTGTVVGNGANGAAIFLGGAGSVDNSGRIEGPSSGTAGAGIYLSGGAVTNEAGGTIGGYYNAIYFATDAGAVVNDGSIGNTGTASEAIFLGAGGSVVNGSSTARNATISATRSGVDVTGAAGTVTNYGTILSTTTTGHGSAVYMTGGGTVTNQAGALIESSHTGVAEVDVVGTVINDGTIQSTSTTTGVGVYQDAGGLIVNNAGGTIIGADEAIVTEYVASTILNYGLVTNPAPGVAMYLGGGTVVNGSTSNSTAAIYGNGAGIVIVDAAGTVTNFGTIESSYTGTFGVGVYLGAGGTVTNEASGTIVAQDAAVVGAGSPLTVYNAGLIESRGVGYTAYGVYLAAGGEVVNGSSTNTTAQILGGYAAVETIDAPATIVNYGTIASSSAGAGVYLKGGGLVTNGPGGDIAATIQSTAGAGIAIDGPAGTVANYGTILSQGTYSGVGIYSSGSLVNVRLIEGGGGTAAAGVYIGDTVPTTGAVTITNSGTIAGSIGIEMGSLVAGPTTIINYGSILGSGGTAIQLGGDADTVVIEPGSSISGAIAGFTVGDKIDFAHEVGTSVALSDGTLDLLNGSSVVAQVSLDGAFADSQFTLHTDNAGGTDIGVRTDLGQSYALTSTGFSDALMTEAGGALVLDEVSGGAMTYTQIGGLGPEWEFEGAGPLLGDGSNQFLLCDDDSASPNFGAVVTGEVDGGAAEYTQVGGVGPEWQFEGVGALTGGNSADFLIWDGSNSNPGFGALVVGAVVGGATQYTQIGAIGPEWQFEGVGGFLNNGSTDFLLWDTDSSSQSYGAVVVGQDVGGAAQYTAVGGLDPTAWQFEGTGDLLDDGKNSFLIRNVSSGELVVGEVDGGTAHYTGVAGVGPEWQFLGVGNYDGASPAEFLIFNANGDSPNGSLFVGTISGGATTYQQVGGVGPTQWTFHPTTPALLG